MASYLASGMSCDRLVSHALVALAIAFHAASAVAQDVPSGDSRSVVRGEIRTMTSPIQGATVRVETVVRVTDARGQFAMVVARGRRVVHVTAIGFAPLDTAVIVMSEALDLTLMLRPLGVLLDSVRVTARWDAFKPARDKDTGKFDEFFARKARAVGGRFFTREDIEGRA